jgi:hypothetical protein
MTSKIAAITLSLSLAFAGSAALAQGHIAGAAVGAAAGAHSKHAVAGAHGQDPPEENGQEGREGEVKLVCNLLHRRYQTVEVLRTR